MGTRLTHVPIDLVDHIPSFIASRDSQIANSVLVRTHNCSTLSLIKALYAIRNSPLSSSEYYRRSEIRLKRSFLAYVAICIDNGFITKSKSNTNTIYAITTKGQSVLELFVQKSN